MTLSDYFLVPYVVAQRLPLLWWEALGFVPKGRSESERMVSEKVDAFAEGVAAIQKEMMQTSMDMGAAMMSGRSSLRPALRGAERAARAAMEPSGRTLRGNARRLSKKR